jgi:membrane-associated phospholipid phosphatase
VIPLTAVEPQTRFWDRVAERFTTRWRTKLVSNVLGFPAFFWAYFWVLKHPLFKPYEMPFTALDSWIGFFPAAILLYGSLWVYVSLPLALFIRKSEFLSFGVAAFALTAAGMVVFIVWPTTMPSSDIVWSQHPLTAFLKNVDASGNACPSLHVAFAVFTLGWLHRLLREMGAGLTIKTVNWLWCAAIVYSTIATRQHVVLDVVAGAALGAIIVTANLLWLRRAELRPSVSQSPTQIASSTE